MASFNKLILVGNLTRDPELKHTPSGTAVCEIGLAVNHTWRDRDGNKREEVCFVDGNIFGKSAEIFNQYMSKGQSVLVEGRLKFDQWTTQDGQKRSKHRISVDNFTFLGGGSGGEGRASNQGASGYGGQGQSSGNQYQSAQPNAGQSAPNANVMDQSYDAPPPSDSDVPF